MMMRGYYSMIVKVSVFDTAQVFNESLIDSGACIEASLHGDVVEEYAGMLVTDTLFLLQQVCTQTDIYCHFRHCQILSSYSLERGMYYIDSNIPCL
jgi:hypothetical protein